MDTKKKRRWNDLFIDEKRGVRERLFLMQTAILFVATLVLVLSDWLAGAGVQALAVQASGALLYLVMGLLTVKFHREQIFGALCSALVIGVVLPQSFLSGGGAFSGVPTWFVLFTLFTVQVLTGWRRYILLAADLVCILSCYYTAYFHDELLRPQPRPLIYQNSLVSLLVVCLAVYLMVGFEVRLLREAIHRAEEERQASERMNKAQSRFFSSMSHEIRTPVNAIISLNEMILREKISPEVEEDANNVRASGKLLLNVINDILDISKIEAGNMEIIPVEYDVGNMFSELVGMFWTQARDKGLELRLDVDPEMPDRLFGDEVRIKQILVNVLSNAIKYTAEGSVTFSVQPQYSGGELTVIYTVTDTGMGIKKESLPYLFAAFRREDEELNRNIEGTGLGLSIVKQLVDLMGGTITVNSVYRKGSSFVIAIPQKRIGEAYISPEKIEQRHETVSKTYVRRFEAPEARVLVVDDNRTNLMVVQKLLRSTGVQVDTAESGLEALGKTQTNTYHIIFMDHMMPEMDGIECLHQIRHQTGGQCKDSRVVALTANAGSENNMFYAGAGFDGYLVKPIDSQRLEQECVRLLPRDMVLLTAQEETAEEEEEEAFQVQEKRARENVCVTTNSVADLPQEVLQRYHIGVIPYCVSTLNGIFRDGVEIDANGLIDYMKKSENYAFSLPPGKEDYEAFFADTLQQANNVIHVGMSGRIPNSGTEIAQEAAQTFENVSVVDSMAISGGLGLLALEAAICARRGDRPEQIVEHLNQIKRRLSCSFIVDSLDVMARNKQVSPLLQRLIEALMAHPVMRLSRGRIRLETIFIGTQRTIWRRYIRRALRARNSIDGKRIIVTYAGLSADDVRFVREEVEKRLLFDEVIMQKASPSITANCGKNTLGLFYFRSSAAADLLR